jgi:hypothetical protein
MPKRKHEKILKAGAWFPDNQFNTIRFETYAFDIFNDGRGDMLSFRYYNDAL